MNQTIDSITASCLVVYARMYLSNLPASAGRPGKIVHLRPLEAKLSELLCDAGWYCDPWPGREHLITFFWDDRADERGFDARCQVDLQEKKVYPL